MPTAASGQLPVYAPGIVALAEDDVQAILLDYFLVHRNVDAAARHIGRNGDSARLSSQGNNFCFPLVLRSIKYLMLHPRL